MHSFLSAKQYEEIKMPQPNRRSRTYRRVKRKLPGNTIKLHYKLKKPKAHSCGACGRALAGTVRERPAKLASYSKTQRRPQRPFSGVLCSKCSREKIRNMVRSAESGAQ